MWLVCLFLILSTHEVHAQSATSSSYVFDAGDFSAVDFTGESENFQLEGGSNAFGSSTYAQFLNNKQGMYQNFPRMARALIASTSELEMTVDQLALDFGALTPGIMVQKQNQVLINSNIPTGYSLYIQENAPLQTEHAFGQLTASEREVIPKTVCDNGSCTLSQASVWQNQDVAGYGYTVLAADGLPDFQNGQAYRPLPSAINNELAELIAQDLQTSQVISNRLITVQYQVGSAPDNVAGTYTNAISYTLIPNF